MDHWNDWKHRFGRVFAQRAARRQGHPSVASAVVVALVLGLLFTSWVHADSAPVTYFACVNNSSGTIHMISATDTCPTGSQEITWNQLGPQGPAGPTGPQGLPGSAPNVQLVTGPADTTGILGATSANCPLGMKVSGGGFNIAPIGADFTVLDNQPDPTGTSWLLLVRPAAGSIITITAYALCV